MAGAVFCDPKPVKRIGEVNSLVITKFNTIKGNNFGEIDISKFLKRIKSGINKSKISYDNMDIKIIYKINVYKVNNNKYEIVVDNDKPDCYYINTDNNSYLKKELDKYCDITSRHDFERQSYEKIQNDVGVTNENIATLNYLKKVKKHLASSIRNNILLLLSLPIGISSFYLSTIFRIPLLPILSGVGSIVSFFSNAGYYEFNFNNNNGLLKRIKLNKLISKKIDQITKRLANSKANINSNMETTVTKDESDKYKDGMFEYMHSINNAITKLNHIEQRKKITELETILDEYVTRMSAFKNGDHKGLTLDDTELKIKSDTINKLASLQMEINDIINNGNKNSTFISESNKIKRELQTSLSRISEEDTCANNSGYAKAYRR